MAGLGRKVFNAGEVLSAANVQGYLQDQVVQVYSGTAARSSALGTAVSEGMTSYLTDSNELSVYTSNGTAAWSPVNLSQSPNAIINGAFDIWQRGDSVTVTGAYSYTADRWKIFTDTGVTSVVSKQTHTPGSAPTGSNNPFYMRATKSANNGGWVADQPIEDARSFAGQTVTLSFWAKAGSATTITPKVIQSFGSGGSASVTTLASSVSLTTSFARYSVTVNVPSITGKTVGSNSSLIVRLWDIADANAYTFDFDEVQLEAGSVATPFRRNAPSLQGELAACQRYYQALSTSPSTLMTYQPTTSGGFSANAYNHRMFVVEMRGAPTVTFYAHDGTAGAVTLYNSGSPTKSSSVSSIGVNTWGWSGNFSGSWGTNADSGLLAYGFKAEAEL